MSDRVASLHDPVATEWKPGDAVMHSGVYRVRHGSSHPMFSGSTFIEQHQAICLVGQTFPLCHRCGEEPRFTLADFGEPIEENEHFKPRA